MAGQMGIMEWTLSLAGAGVFANQLKGILGQFRNWQDVSKRTSAALDMLSKNWKEGSAKSAQSYANLTKSAKTHQSELQRLRAEYERTEVIMERVRKKRSEVSAAQEKFRAKHTTQEIADAPNLSKFDKNLTTQGRNLGGRLKAAGMDQARNLLAQGAAKKGLATVGSGMAGAAIAKGATAAAAAMGKFAGAAASSIGILGKLAIVVGAVVKVVRKVVLGNKEVAASFSATEFSVVKSNKAVAQAENVYRNTHLSLEDARKAMGALNASAYAGTLNFRDFGHALNSLKLQNASADVDTLAKSLVDLASRGSSGFEDFAAKTGISLEEIKRRFYDSFDTATVDERMGTITKVVEKHTAASQQAMQGWERYWSTKWRKVKGGYRVVKQYVGTAGGRDALANPDVPVKKNLMETMGDVKTESKELNASAEKWKRTLSEVVSQWGDIKSAQLDVAESMEDLTWSINEATASGSKFYSQTALNVAQKFKKGIEFSKGVGDPQRAMQAFQGSASSLVDNMNELKGIQMSLTGLNKYGVFTGQRTVGREAYVQRETAEHIRKQTASALTDNVQELKDNKQFGDAATLQEALDKIQGGNSPETIQQGMLDAATFTADKAKEQAAKLEKSLEKQAEALAYRIPSLLVTLHQDLAGLNALNMLLLSHNKGMQKRLGEMPELQNLLATKSEAMGVMALTGMSNLLDPEMQKNINSMGVPPTEYPQLDLAPQIVPTAEMGSAAGQSAQKEATQAAAQESQREVAGESAEAAAETARNTAAIAGNTNVTPVDTLAR